MTKIRDIMSTPVASIARDASVQDAAKKMTDLGIGSLIVEGENRSLAVDDVGFFTERDIVRRVAALGLVPADTKVEAVMSTPTIAVDVAEPVERASDLMIAHDIRRVAAIEDELVVGVVTMQEVHKWLTAGGLRRVLAGDGDYHRHD